MVAQFYFKNVGQLVNLKTCHFFKLYHDLDLVLSHIKVYFFRDGLKTKDYESLLLYFRTVL